MVGRTLPQLGYGYCSTNGNTVNSIIWDYNSPASTNIMMKIISKYGDITKVSYKDYRGKKKATTIDKYIRFELSNTPVTSKLTASVSKTIGSLLSTIILYLLGFGAPKDEMLQWTQN